MISSEQAAQAIERIDEALKTADNLDAFARASMQIISEQFPHYNWVGIYWLKGEELELGPYVGAATEHTRIPVGRGVCGTAVAQNANQIIDDVNQLENYLACSLETKSEIVVLIRDVAGKILGQIDADGHTVGAFDKSDEAFLEEIASRIAAFWAKEEGEVYA